MQGRKRYTEKLFTSFQLSNHVPEDNFYRRLRSVLDLHWLYRATKKYYGTEGQQSIDPIVFFKLILVGYLENLNSDRKIIEHSKLRLDILFFLGYDLDEELPWHSTISRTRALCGEEVFKELFSKVLSGRNGGQTTLRPDAPKTAKLLCTEDEKAQAINCRTCAWYTH